MMTFRPAQERGVADFGWLHSQQSFSFGDYYDPKQMGFGFLRVINEDQVAGGKGFGAHPHQNMEIISFVMSGALKHKDSMGNETQILPGEIQRMSAGTGVVHSEFNPLANEKAHFLQIWIIPDKKGYPPSYAQVNYLEKLKESELIQIASQKGGTGCVSLNQDTNIFLGKTKKAQVLRRDHLGGRDIWVQMISGSLKIGDQEFRSGDGAGFRKIENLEIQISNEGAEFLIFDMAPYLGIG